MNQIATSLDCPTGRDVSLKERSYLSHMTTQADVQTAAPRNASFAGWAKGRSPSSIGGHRISVIVYVSGDDAFKNGYDIMHRLPG